MAYDELHWEHLQPAVLSILAWTAVAGLFSFVIFRKRSLIYSNRAVSLLHACVAIPLCIRALQHGWNPLAHFGQTTTQEELTVLLVALGYFVYDTLACACIEEDRANAAHHVCSIAAVGVGIFNMLSGTELVSCLVLMEVTNPFLHARFFFKEHGLGHSDLAAVNDVVFAVSFGICRLIVGPFITFGTLFCPTSSKVVKVGGMGIQLVSCLWCYKIGRMAMRKAKKLNHTGESPKPHRNSIGAKASKGAAAVQGNHLDAARSVH